MRGVQTVHVLVEIQRLQERNNLLSTRLGQMRDSRDTWKKKAIERRKEIENLKRQLERRPERRPLHPADKKRYHTQDEWRQHDLIVARIRALG